MLKELKFSKKQHEVINRSELVTFVRGSGATFSIVYGALKYAFDNPESNIIVFGDDLWGFKNSVYKMMDTDVVDKDSVDIISTIDEMRVAVKDSEETKSYITFTHLNKLYKMVGTIFDLAYTDTGKIDISEELKVLPCIATESCVVTYFKEIVKGG